jgi:hypothetical protein
MALGHVEIQPDQLRYCAVTFATHWPNRARSFESTLKDLVDAE